MPEFSTWARQPAHPETLNRPVSASIVRDQLALLQASTIRPPHPNSCSIWPTGVLRPPLRPASSTLFTISSPVLAERCAPMSPQCLFPFPPSRLGSNSSHDSFVDSRGCCMFAASLKSWQRIMSSKAAGTQCPRSHDTSKTTTKMIKSSRN